MRHIKLINEITSRGFTVLNMKYHPPHKTVCVQIAEECYYEHMEQTAEKLDYNFTEIEHEDFNFKFFEIEYKDKEVKNDSK